MSALDKIAYMQNQRDEVANQELARELVETKDKEGIHKIALNLWNKNSHIQSDCLKVLYEIGYLDPSLVVDYTEDFLKLLKSKNNRLVWGSMIALSTIARLKAAEIYTQRELILNTIQNGSVITVDNGIKILVDLAACLPEQSPKIFPYLLEHLDRCHPKEIPQHAEKTLVAVNVRNLDAFVAVLERRKGELTAAQLKRVTKVIKIAQKMN
jgi:hypothetical protein